jgi:transposase
LWDELRKLVTLVESQAAQLEAQALRIAELEEKLNADSGNSSKPPSQDRMKGGANKEKRKSSGRKKGAQPGHVHQSRDLLPESELDDRVCYYPDAHCGCGGKIEMESQPYHRHQVFDLPEIRYTVVEHQRFAGCYKSCGCRSKAPLPDWLPSGQMGAGLIAWIALMSGHYRLSTRSLQSLLESQWELSFSLGAISRVNALKLLITFKSICCNQE